MTSGAFATAAAWSYGLALVGYLAFSARLAIGSPKDLRARLLLAALAVTAAWSVCSLIFGVALSSLAYIVANAADALRYALWYAFLWNLSRNDRTTTSPANARIAASAIGALVLASVWLGQGVSEDALPALSRFRAGFAVHLLMAVIGLMLVEQLIRRVQRPNRWAIKPLAVGLGGVFGFDLFLYADAMLLGVLDRNIWLARGLANFIVIPFIAIATARNAKWTLELHFSRGAVIHSSALLMSGAFLLAVAGAGYFVRYVGGEWGAALQIELLFAATLFVVLVLASGSFRSKLKVFVSKHFFAYRYDYREEWLRFTRTLSDETSNQTLQTRIVVALADLVESPGGSLWLKDESRGFVQAARWNAPASDANEPVAGSLASFLQRTNWIVSVPEWEADRSRYRDLELPAWLRSNGGHWLIVPLASATELMGFVVLATPRTAIEVNWEVRDLLKAATRQAASYLGQVRATEALIEVRKFDAFNRMSAFVVHDLKNLVAQLSLMLKNAQRHRNNPEFQADMLATVENVVTRMHGLMRQLRIGTEPLANPRQIDVDAVLRHVHAAKVGALPSVDVESCGPVIVLGHEDRLERVIGHLVQNAIDASSPGAKVTLRLECDESVAIITVSDSGVGMAPEFVRERLFKPFQTTKPSGMGIGVYESAQYLAAIGGEIHFDSRPGAGTDVRVRLPRVASAGARERDATAVAAASIGVAS